MPIYTYVFSCPDGQIVVEANCELNAVHIAADAAGFAPWDLRLVVSNDGGANEYDPSWQPLRAERAVSIMDVI